MRPSIVNNYIATYLKSIEPFRKACRTPEEFSQKELSFVLPYLALDAIQINSVTAPNTNIELYLQQLELDIVQLEKLVAMGRSDKRTYWMKK